MLDELNSKVDILVSSDTPEIIDDINNQIKDANIDIKNIGDNVQQINDNILNIESSIEDSSQKLSDSDAQIASMLQELSSGLEIAFSKNEVDFGNVKNLIIEQKKFIDSLEPGKKLDALKKCLDEINEEVNNLSSSTSSDAQQLNKAIKDIKDSIMSAVITVFDQVSFIEETEDIKDFVEVRTEQINKNIARVTKQLQMLSTSTNEHDYNYSMQDIETDLAKLRLALNDLQNGKINTQLEELNEISEKLHTITSLVDTLTQGDILNLKLDIAGIKEQTQFLIATSDKSYNALNDGMEDFGEIINENLSVKVENINKKLEESANSDNVVRQALIYMGEWIDSASESLNKISLNSEGIDSTHKMLNTLKDSTLEKIQDLKNKFEMQEERLDRLESNLDRILSVVEKVDDSGISKKIDKLEKQIAKISTNIEKLTEYVE